MAHANSESKNDRTTAAVNAATDGELKPTTFHDFLSYRGQGNVSASAACGGDRAAPEFSPSAASDQGSDRNVSNHLEGIPFYGSRGDLMGPETSNRFTGNKRSNSDSFMASQREKFLKGQADSQENPVLTKLIRYSMGERLEEPPFNTHQLRPIAASFTSQPSIRAHTDANTSKWDKSTPLNLGPVLQYPPLSVPITPFGYQSQSNRMKEANVGTSVISQTAADEGSRTGIKGSGILTSIPWGVLIRSGKQKCGVSNSEPESFTKPSQRGTESAGCQMTIFYGGQAHVFDNIQPNKADVIMALAGSNGGSWSTIYTPNSEGNYQGDVRSNEKNATFKEAKIGSGGKAEE